MATLEMISYFFYVKNLSFSNPPPIYRSTYLGKDHIYNYANFTVFRIYVIWNVPSIGHCVR